MPNSEIKNFSKEAIIIGTSITAWLSVGNCQKAVDFYNKAFGAIVVYRLEAPDGSLVVGRLSIDGAEFWLGESSFENDNQNPVSFSENPIRMILTVTDPDALFHQALATGATQIFPVGEEHGWRLGRLVDPFGHHWEIGRPIK